MKQNLKRIFSILLCLVVIASLFLGVPLKQNAAAIGPQDLLIADGVYYILTWALGCLGITVAYKGGMLQALQQYCYENPTIYNDLNQIAATAVTGNLSTLSLHFSVDILKWIKGTLLPSLTKYFTKSQQDISIKITDADRGNINGVNFTYKATFATEYQAFQLAEYTQAKYFGTTSNADSPLIINVNNKIYKYYIYETAPVNSAGFTRLYLYTNSNTTTGEGCTPVVDTNAGKHYSSIMYPDYVPGGWKSWVDCRFGFRLVVKGAYKYLYPYLAYSYIDSKDVVRYAYYDSDTPGQMIDVTPYKEYSRVVGQTEVPYDYVIDYSESEFYNALQKLIDSMTGTLDIPIPGIGQDVVEGKEDIADGKPKDGTPYIPDWAQWWDKLGIKEWMKTVQESLSKTESDFNIPQMPTSIIDKFPFCIPKDLFNLVSALNATAVAPKFTIPFTIKSINYTYNFELDLSQYENLAQPIRIGMTLLYVLGLILITRKLIKG